MNSLETPRNREQVEMPGFQYFAAVSRWWLPEWQCPAASFTTAPPPLQPPRSRRPCCGQPCWVEWGSCRRQISPPVKLNAMQQMKPGEGASTIIQIGILEHPVLSTCVNHSPYYLSFAVSYIPSSFELLFPVSSTAHARGCDWTLFTAPGVLLWAFTYEQVVYNGTLHGDFSAFRARGTDLCPGLCTHVWLLRSMNPIVLTG